MFIDFLVVVGVFSAAELQQKDICNPYVTLQKMKGSRNTEQVGRMGEVLTLSAINFTYFSHIINIGKKEKRIF